MKYIVPIIIQLYAMQIIAQVPTPKFKDITPLWTYLAEDKNYIQDSSIVNKYNTVDLMQQIAGDSEIFLYSSCQNSKGDSYGGILTKLNRKTGSLIWEKYLNRFSGVERQEYFYDPQLTTHNKIKFIGKQKIALPTNTLPFWWWLPSRPVKRIYDRDTGELLEYTYEATDTIGIPSGPGGGAFIDAEKLKVYCESSLKGYYFSGVDSGGVDFKFYKMDDNFKLDLISYDSISHIPTGMLDAWTFSKPQLVRSLNDSIILGWVWHQNYKDDVFRSQLIWIKVDKDYKISAVRTKDVGDYMDVRNIYQTRGILHVNNDIILTEYYITPTEGTKRWLLWMDSEGNNKANTLDIRYGEHSYGDECRVIYNSGNKLYLAAKPSYKDINGVDFLSIDINNTIQYYGSLVPETKEDFLLGNGNHILTEDNMLILMGKVESTYYYAIAFDAKDLGIDLTSSVTKVDNQDFTLYPNPCRHTCNIDLPEGLVLSGNILVHDVKGILVLQQSLADQSTIQLDTSDLPIGVYQISITDNKGTPLLPIKKLVRIE